MPVEQRARYQAIEQRDQGFRALGDGGDFRIRRRFLPSGEGGGRGLGRPWTPPPARRWRQHLVGQRGGECRQLIAAASGGERGVERVQVAEPLERPQEQEGKG